MVRLPAVLFVVVLMALVGLSMPAGANPSRVENAVATDRASVHFASVGGGDGLAASAITVDPQGLADLGGLAVVEGNADGPAATAITADPRIIGALGGPALAVTAGIVDGTPYAFFGSGPLVVAADVSDPAKPVEVGRLLVPGQVSDILFRESDALLFVANDDEGGLRILDVSDPSAMVEAGFLNSPGFADEIAVVGDHAFVNARTAGLQIMDVSTPSDPVLVATLTTPCCLKGISVQGNLAFLDPDLVV